MASATHSLERLPLATRERLAAELYARVDVAHRAMMAFQRAHDDSPLTEALAVCIMQAALGDYQRAADEVLAEQGKLAPLDEAVDRMAEAIQTPEAEEEEACACCTPGVPLSKHTHKPVTAFRETPGVKPLELHDGPLGANRYVVYRNQKGEERDIVLGHDLRVEVEVRGETWGAKETLRKAGLKWNRKQAPDSVWYGRAGPNALALLGALDDGESISVRLIEGAGDQEPAPPRPPRTDSPGPDFY
jgi:hypothetical protein